MTRCFFSLVTTLLILTAPAFSQSKAGDVACVYITTPNLDSSAAVYEKLGFVKKAANEFPSPWLQLTDGSILLMLRKENKPYIGLTYYANDVSKVVAELEKNGVAFASRPGANDALKRYVLKSPDGFEVVIANNLGGFEQPTGATLVTMNPADFHTAGKYPNQQCGAFGEFAHPVTNLNASLEFWKKLGFKLMQNIDKPYPHAILTDGLMIIGLHQTKQFNYPAVTYFGINTEERVQALRQKNLTSFTEVLGKRNQALTTWEGQHFFLFSLDF